MATPTVTVIIPAYNAAGYVDRTLQSLRNQTFAEFEAIVVDDGSTDETAAVAQAVVDADPRFRLIRQTANGGVAEARNRALSEARGRYLANLDSDDMWLPTFLQRTVAALDADEETAFAFARTLWIDEYDRLLPQADQPLPPVVGYRELLIHNPVGNGSAMLMRTAAVREVGGYDEGLVRDFGQAEDWLLLLQLSWRGAVATVAEPLVLYRILPRSSSHALDRSARGALEVIRRCESVGPPLRRRDYWTARSLTLLWLARRALSIGRAGMGLAFAAQAYLSNPLWFTLRELRQPVLNMFLKPFAAARRSPAAGAGVGAPAG